MNRIQWYGLRFVERLGITGLLAIAVGVFCLIFVFTSLLPAKSLFSTLQAVKQSESMRVVKHELTPEENLQNFVKRFPTLSQRTSAIQDIMGKAKALDMEVDNVSYKTDRQSGSKLSKTYVDFTVYCTYPEMRTFLNSVLADMPFVSLDQLTISRDDVVTDVVEVRMRLTLHLVA